MQSIQTITHKNCSMEELDYLCIEILNLDPKFRFVGIINDKGKLVVEKKKKELKVFVDPKDLEILLMETALGIRMRREHDAQLGPVDFIISYDRNAISIIFPFETDILYVIAEKDLDFSKIPSLISQLLKQKLSKKIAII